jgi:putative Holliday junction resolvase
MAESRVLALDVGRARIGVALSDPLGLTAQPMEVIDRRRQDALARIAALVQDYAVSELLVGLPMTLAGERAQAADDMASFVTRLRALGPPVVEWDERLTTRQAERVMIAQGARRRERRDNIDKVAAAILLQSYLDAR